MIPKLLTGAGIAGLVDYVTRDKPRPDDPRPSTAKRVEHVESLGLPGASPDVMTRCMQGLTADQRAIKQRAGTSTRGRKLREPYGHLILSTPADQPLTVEELREAARGALAAIGITERHYGLLAVHNDTTHRHAHVTFSRIDPETGRAAKLDNSKLALSRWAHEWERQHGGIVVLGRDPETRAQPRQARDAIGRLHIRTPDELREWRALYREQKETRTPQRVAKRQRAALNRRQNGRRIEQEGQRVDRFEAAAAAPLAASTRPRGSGDPRRRRRGDPARSRSRRPTDAASTASRVTRRPPRRAARDLRAIAVPTPDRRRQHPPPRVRPTPEAPARDLRAIAVPTPDRCRQPFRCPVSLVPPRPRGEVAQGVDEVRCGVAHVAMGEERATNGGRGPGETTRGLRDAGAGAPAGMLPPGVGIDAKHDEAKGRTAAPARPRAARRPRTTGHRGPRAATTAKAGSNRGGARVDPPRDIAVQGILAGHSSAESPSGPTESPCTGRTGRRALRVAPGRERPTWATSCNAGCTCGR